MNFTSRMAALLGELRRERNGAVADSMRFYGKAYGLNYGVSLPTLRRIARAETPDADFASYLYLQDVRELRLLAFHIACPERISTADFPAWAAGIVNSEVAEEAAFALLWRIEPFAELFTEWISSENPLLQYAALMAASRSSLIAPEWIEPALEVVRRHASNCGEEVAGAPAEPRLSPAESHSSLAESHSSLAEPHSSPAESHSSLAEPHSSPAESHSSLAEPHSSPAEPHSSPAESHSSPAEPRLSPAEPHSSLAEPGLSSSDSHLPSSLAARLTAQGAVALLAAFGNINEENRQTVIRAVGSPCPLPAMKYLYEELVWRLQR